MMVATSFFQTRWLFLYGSCRILMSSMFFPFYKSGTRRREKSIRPLDKYMRGIEEYEWGQFTRTTITAVVSVFGLPIKYIVY